MVINAFYEDGYNTRLTIDGETLDIGPMIEDWYTKSETARDQLNAHLDVQYGDANRETLDIFPATTPTGRWLVFIHGGYWRATTKESSSFLATAFVDAGYNVALIEYDLCPAVTLGVIVEQVRRAIAWIYHHAVDFDLTCDEMVISGHSAGGHLTAMMWATDWTRYHLPGGLISGGIALSGLFDLDPLQFTNMHEQVQFTPPVIASLSPARLAPQISAPLVVAVGERESAEFHRQTDIINAMPAWAEVIQAVVDVPGKHHFDILAAFMDLDDPMWAALNGT